MRLPFQNQKRPVYSPDGAPFHRLYVPRRSPVDIIHPAPAEVEPPLDLIEQKPGVSGFEHNQCLAV